MKNPLHQKFKNISGFILKEFGVEIGRYVEGLGFTVRYWFCYFNSKSTFLTFFVAFKLKNTNLAIISKILEF